MHKEWRCVFINIYCTTCVWGVKLEKLKYLRRVSLLYGIIRYSCIYECNPKVLYAVYYFVVSCFMDHVILWWKTSPPWPENQEQVFAFWPFCEGNKWNHIFFSFVAIYNRLMHFTEWKSSAAWLSHPSLCLLSLLSWNSWVRMVPPEKIWQKHKLLAKCLRREVCDIWQWNPLSEDFSAYLHVYLFFILWSSPSHLYLFSQPISVFVVPVICAVVLSLLWLTLCVSVSYSN